MGFVLVTVFLLLLLLGMPIPFALGISATAGLLYGDINLMLIPQKIVTGTESFSLLAVPFFILAGDLMYRGGLAKRLVDIANSILGYVTGGLGMVTVLAAIFFAAISGSAPATTASIGSVMIPEMEKKGYKKDFGAALATAAGPIGQMIPPSIPLIIWALMANISISKLFLAGILPGIVMGIGLMIICYIIAKKEGYKGAERLGMKDVIKSFREGFWALLAPVIILGGIYGGIFTPTEAAAVAVVYGLVVGLLIYKDLKVNDLPQIFIQSMRTTTIVIFIISVASLFGWIMASEQIGQAIVTGILSITTNKYLVLLMVNILLLAIGCMMDNIAAMVILSGVLTSLGAQIGIDPIHFGAMVVINFAVGMATPPIGYSLFVGASISDLSIEQISSAIWPFLLALLAGLALITYIPAITLAIPELFLN